MRISDWSSDVCSSDLDQLALMEQLAHRARHPGFALDPLDVEILGVLVRPVIGIHRLAERLRGRFPVAIMVAIAMAARLALPGNGPELLRHLLTVLRLLAFLCLLTGALGGKPRSEEHTSELQSLMRISYAVFCLKKKKQKYKILTTRQESQKRTLQTQIPTHKS